jgi:small-conductance mechanosensitive channel
MTKMIFSSSAYVARDWQSLFQAVVAAAASLLGLLFVAASIRVEVVNESARHRARAREALGQLLVLVVVGVLVLIPGQTREVLGAELIGLGVIVAVVTARLQVNTIRRLSPQLRRQWLIRDMTYNIGVVAIPLAGLGLVFGALGGLYWLMVSTVLFFTWASLQAWWLLVESR